MGIAYSSGWKRFPKQFFTNVSTGPETLMASQRLCSQRQRSALRRDLAARWKDQFESRSTCSVKGHVDWKCRYELTFPLTCSFGWELC